MPVATATPGVTLVSRKPEGYDIVIADELPKLVAAVNLTVMETYVWLACRLETLNVTEPILEPI